MKRVVVLEISGATEEMIERDIGKLINDFCEKNKGTGITASVVTEKAGKGIIDFINGEEN